MGRDKLGSRLGFILISAGCAIGVGNVWKFPYIAGQYGGGWFVLIYLLFILLLGVPALTIEFTLGRASGVSPVKMYQKLEKPGQKWHYHGYIALAGNYLLMMFYTIVSGWMIQYCVKTIKGDFVGLNTEQIGEVFNGVIANPITLTIYVGIVVLLGYIVCSKNIQNGLEAVSKVMMSSLLIIMIALSINSILLPNAAEGLKFYLLPDWSKVQQHGLINVITAAMNQAFFTLSIGMGSMAIFGSYIGKDRSLLGESTTIALLDTFVAFCSGLIIFPACYSFGVDAGSGPSLIFITLPNIFNNIPFGRVWGTLFFIFMSFAAMSTIFAVFENIISCTMELFGKSRRVTALVNAILLFVLSLPCILGFNVLSDITPFGAGTNIMDLEDFLVSNIILPIGALVFVIYCVTKYGIGWNNFVEEANTGKGLKICKWMRWYITFVLPVIISIVFVLGMINFFR